MNETRFEPSRICRPLQARRGRHPVATVVQELEHLPADLQLAKIAMQIQPVRALQVQGDMPVQHVVHGYRHRPLDPGRHDTLPHVAYARKMRSPARSRLRYYQPRRYQAEPVWMYIEERRLPLHDAPVVGHPCAFDVRSRPLARTLPVGLSDRLGDPQVFRA